MAAVGLSQAPVSLLAQARPPIIDMHLHADLPPHEVPPGTPAVCRPEPCQGAGRATANHAETLRKSLDAMDRYNIVKAFLSGLDPATVQQWVAAAPDRFIAAPFILQPGKPDLETLRRAYAAGRFTGMGEIATQLTGVPPNHPTLEPYFALAEERDLPVLIHTLGIGPYLPGFRSAMGSPLLLEEVLVRHPKLRLFVENSGYPYRDEMIAMMTQYPQLHGDVSTISWVLPRAAFHDYLQALVRAGLSQRRSLPASRTGREQGAAIKGRIAVGALKCATDQASSTARTLAASADGKNGFWTKSSPVVSTPRCAMMSAV